MPIATQSHSAVCLALTRAISRASTLEEIYAAALDALGSGLGVERSSISLDQADGARRFMAHRGLSEAYRQTVEANPWTRTDTEPIVIADVKHEPVLAPHLDLLAREHIAALTVLPLVSGGRAIGRLTLFYSSPHQPSVDDLQLASIIAAQVGCAVGHTRTEDQVRQSEERLRFALDAASMGTWDWHVATNTVAWSDNLEEIHGLPAGTFDGTFEGYMRHIHPDDRDRVMTSVQHALNTGAPYDVEYRLVAPDGTIRWCEGKGRVEYHDGKPVGMNGVCMLVSRRKEAELSRLAAAEDASHLKDEFLAMLSHELRTPLNAILGWVQMWQSGAVRPERQSTTIEVIGRNARLQARLIEDILDVSRIITGKLDIERVPLALTQVVETAVDGILPAADAKRLEVLTEIGEGIPAIEGDPKRLHQVMNNLLSNAVKFTPEGGTIDVKCVIDDDRIQIVIRDSGVGIAPEFLPFVFDRFRQADSRSTRKHGGLGLGLAISRHLIEQHGGTIVALSQGPNEGTTVVVTLPTSISTASVLKTTTDPAYQPDMRFDGLQALVVEDQEDSRELLATLLELRGARVVRCSCAIDALEAMATQSMQLLVADIAMPDIDGYELIGRLRSDGNQIPAIAVTAYARLADRERAFASGYAAYCPKPVDTDQFLRMVATLV